MAEIKNHETMEDKNNANLDNDEPQRRLILEPIPGWSRRESSYPEE
jgi:hypothetical protein